MTDEHLSGLHKRSRSPAFPYVGLAKAIEKATVLSDKVRRGSARVADIAEDWGISPTSSGIDRTIAALVAFGLIEDGGSGENRKVRLTDLGARILEDKRPGVREMLLKEAATKPKAIADYLAKWPEGRPENVHAISDLKFEGNFNDDAAKLFLRVFDETIDYAGLRNLTNETRLLLDAVSSTQTTTDDADPQLLKPALGSRDQATIRIAPGNRQTVFALDEGDVILSFPSNLSSASFEELRAYLDIFLRKAQRAPKEVDV
jgi:DNA-binding MarR family transcriptional regulator